MNEIARYRSHIIVGLIALLIGVAFGYWGLTPAPSSSFVEEIRSNAAGYAYINPLLFVRTTKDPSPAFAALEQELEENIEEAKQEGKVTSAAVYFRELNSGRWTGVNESETYTPSSLLKVAVMMSVLRKADENPGELATPLRYDPVKNVGTAQFVAPGRTLLPGYHPVSELIEAMIVRSDNAASTALSEHVNRQFFDLYTAFHLPELPDNYQNFMSPRAYSSLFRALYNATYLSESDSERALAMLTRVEYRGGLVAGVPAGTIVAHKFGENATGTAEGEIVSRELHDCGIVYYPEHPYFICVMTEGNEFTDLEAVIREQSAIVYRHAGELLKAVK